MDLTHGHLQLLHWYYAGFLALLGLVVIVKELYGGEGAFNAADGPTLRRLDDAYDRRHEPERPSRVRAFRWGAACIAVAVLAAFTSIQFIILYDIVCLLGAAFAAASYFQIRNVADK